MVMRKWKVEAAAVLLCFLAVVFLRGVVARRVGENGILFLDEQGDNIRESALSHRTERIDPLDHLKKYRGGFNITNKHYWSSTIFTGKFGYFIAVAWLISGLICASVLIISYTIFYFKGRSEKKRTNVSKNGYNWSLHVVALLTLLAIIASGVALKGSTGFHSRAIEIENIVVQATNNASGTISTVSESVEVLQNDTQLSQNVEDSSSLELTSRKLNHEASNIQMKAEKTLQQVTKGLDILNAVTIITVILNLLVIILLLALIPFRLCQTLCVLIILCWLITFLLWAYSGLYYFFGKFAGDICLALDEYRKSPETSTLSTILPCNNHGSAEAIFRDVGERIYDLIQQVNSNITSLSLSLSKLEYICNPFSGPPEYYYHPENCSSKTIRIGDIPKIIEKFACLGSSSGACKPGEFIPASVYGKVQLYTDSMQDILDSYPGMKSLADCKLVKDAFSDILFNHCKPLNKYVHMCWASLATLSTISVLFVLLYASEAHQKSEFLTVRSVKLHMIVTNPSQNGAEIVSKHQKQRGIVERKA
ncbi:uncharacterized protein LOC110092363 [Dendrobium catenatum]|uniref:Uncharacterized protein n=1 Tax=Dendrobium catenatum TaxID=906689 RepID=A0A2I0X2N6_9ASPA|nr:uncharacterized protein LOC110092363 [Dendrobium catenatum]PKU82188.1 hypothetical protein MA16_Dca023421 [Dendrobium catenatum]